MAFESNYERIQQRLHQEASDGPFYGISTDVETKQKSVDGDTAINPSSVIVEEQSTTFGEPRRNRRTYRQERRGWRWRVACRFNQEVTAEAVEKRLVAGPIILPRDAVNDLEQVTLRLLDADTFHPPQQSPALGTQVTFTLEAELSPV